MRKKSICVVTTKSTTIKAFLLEQLNFLSQNGFEVTIICDKDTEFSKSLPKSIKYKTIPMKRGIELGMLRIIWSLYQFFKIGRFDIVQYSTPNAAFYSSIASWLSKTPVRLYCQWGMRFVGYKGLKYKLFKLIEKITCLLSTDIEPDSYSNLYFARNEGLYPPKKSRVIWNGSANGVNLEKFDINMREVWKKEIRNHHRINNNDFVYGFTGRLVKDKGINELLTAYKIIHEKYSPNSKLLIVGPDENNAGIDKKILEWAKSCDAVIICGFTNEIEKYYAAMDVFILPSYREGFGSVVIEAEAMGNPVIVTDIPGPIDAMENGVTGLTVQKGDVDSLVKSMKKLCEDTNLLSHLKGNAVNYATNNFEQKTLWKYILMDRNKLIEKARTKNMGVYKKNA